MLLQKRLKDKVTAVTFYWPSGKQFVTEFYLTGQQNLVTYWEAPAVYVEETDRVEVEALRAFHEVNCEIWEEEGGRETYETVPTTEEV